MFIKSLKNTSSHLRDLRRVEEGLYSRISFGRVIFIVFFFCFFFSSLALINSVYAVSSGFGAECEQLDEGAEEGVQPTLVGHALLHHFLLAWILSCLLNGVGLFLAL